MSLRDYPPVIAAVEAFIADPDSRAFDTLALSVFEFQYERNPAFRRLCDRYGASPGVVRDWRDIPAVPTGAFKRTRLACGEPVRVFRTSGTTGERGEHALPDLGLYRASWRSPFRDHLLPDRSSMPVISLIPHEDDFPDSSLSFMVARVAETFSSGEPLWAVSTAGGLDWEALSGRLAEAESETEPQLILGTAFSFVHVLDRCVDEHRRFKLPPGSRIMDTGGFKGRSRTVERVDLLRLYEDRLGIPHSHVVGEYGMTELCSQFYEPKLVDRRLPGEPEEHRKFEGPPWVRTRVLDPETLDDVPDGRSGLLCHVDLANAWTVSAVLTEDVGVATDGGFRVEGRARGAELRGCSLATEAILGR